MAARLRSIWGDAGTGVLWLSLSVVATFVLGLALQLIALRVLSGGDYATFVFALGIGNVAAALAAAVQPVVAVRAGTARATFLPTSLPSLAIGTAAALTLAVGSLALTVDPLIAVLACAQVPLHALIAVGLGRTQAARNFPQLAGLLVLLSAVRIAVVLPGVLTGRSDAALFVLALPGALVATLLVLALFGAFRGVRWTVASDGRQLLAHYGVWILFAWLINADAVYARLLLSGGEADAYAIAITLGRQPIYAVAPLAIVLIPVTVGIGVQEQRARFRAILAVSGLLVAGSIAVLGIWPEVISGIITGDPARADVFLVRGYALVGSLAAACTLLMTFAFALGRPPQPRTLGALAIVAALASLGVDGPAGLIVVHGIIIVVLTVLCLRCGVARTPCPADAIGDASGDASDAADTPRDPPTRPRPSRLLSGTRARRLRT